MLQNCFYTMYVLVNTPSLLRVLRVFQNQYTNKSLKITQKPTSNLPRDIASSLEITDLFMMGPNILRWVPEPPTRVSIEVLRKFPWYRAQESNPEHFLLGSWVYYHLRQWCSIKLFLYIAGKPNLCS